MLGRFIYPFSIFGNNLKCHLIFHTDHSTEDKNDTQTIRIVNQTTRSLDVYINKCKESLASLLVKHGLNKEQYTRVIVEDKYNRIVWDYKYENIINDIFMNESLDKIMIQPKNIKITFSNDYTILPSYDNDECKTNTKNEIEDNGSILEPK